MRSPYDINCSNSFFNKVKNVILYRYELAEFLLKQGIITQQEFLEIKKDVINELLWWKSKLCSNEC